VARDPGRFKAIAVVAPDTTDKALAALAARGVVGVRFNLVTYDRDALAKAAAAGLLDRLKAAGLCAQIYAHDQQWPALMPVLLHHGVRVIVDHFGVRDISTGVAAPGFQAVLELGRRGNAAVKLSAPFRLAPPSSGYGAIDAFGESLLSAFGIERCVWGSDWPFLDVRDRISYADLPVTLERWLPDAADRRRVLWTNPVRLFGFGEKPA
jgi:predicted TIM-barrel fold metal-dependent hydrolase